MLQSKIIVVIQRDEWEDHYRLMEALCCSGNAALVVIDPMITLPFGLKNGTTHVEITSPQSLKHVIEYYLKPENENERNRIARNGQYIAMKYHRSWNIIEQIVYKHRITSNYVDSGGDKKCDPIASNGNHGSSNSGGLDSSSASALSSSSSCQFVIHTPYYYEKKKKKIKEDVVVS